MSDGELIASLVIVAVTGLLLLWITVRVFRAGIPLTDQQIRSRNVRLGGNVPVLAGHLYLLAPPRLLFIHSKRMLRSAMR